ncbi:MAG: protein kinase [Proteobacteria bacterium]|nr:protein kinase [Pseudomonadota bacterium]
MDLNPGTVVERYTVEGLLGQGGMAVVYKVRHNQLGTQHALKVLTMTSSSVRERLLQEGRVQASLRHPNIVSVTDVVTVQGAPGLVMEYISGPSLEDLLRETPLSVEQAEAVFRGIVAGVDYAHEHGLIHRDLKPANVLIEIRRGKLIPKVTDFGLAKVLESDGGLGRTRSGMTMGTPAYMSPEQIRDSKNVDQRADIFSLGAILYELLTREQAFDGPDLPSIFNRVLGSQYTPLLDKIPELPERLASAVARALETDRDQRLDSCTSLIAELDGGGEAPAAGGPWTGTLLHQAAALGSADPDEPAIAQAPQSHETWMGGESMALSGGSQAAVEPPSQFQSAVNDHGASLAPAGGGSLVTPAPSQSPPPGRSSMWMGLAAGVALSFAVVAGVALVGIGAIGGGMMAGGSTEVEPAEVREPALDAPVEATPADALTPEEAPVEPEPEPVEAVAAKPAAKPAAEPAAKPTPRPTPSPRPTPKPKVVTVTAPAPPAPVVAPAPNLAVIDPAPNAPPPLPASTRDMSKALVTLAGDADGALFIDSSGGRHKAGELAPGTYTVQAFFGDGAAMTAGKVTVSAGETRTVTCYSSGLVCR